MNIHDRFNSLGAYYYMINKCYDPEHRRFATFGGQGSEVCEAWRVDRELFVRDMGAPPTNSHFIKRKDDAAPFSLDNCYWHANQVYIKRTPEEKKEAKARAAAAMEANRQRMMKLSDADVLDILRMAHKEGVSVADLSLLYPVAQTTLRRIVKGEQRPVKGKHYPAVTKQHPRGRAGKGAANPAVRAEMVAFRAAGASIAEVAARFDISESYAYKLLPGPGAQTFEENRVNNAEGMRKARAQALLDKKLASIKNGAYAQPSPPAPLSPYEFREKMRKAAERRAFEAQADALTQAHYADLL